MTAGAPLFPIIIRLAGEPRGKERPRFSSKSGTAYTPKRTRSYEKAIATVARVAMGARLPVAAPVFVAMTALMPIPKSFSKAKRAQAIAGTIWPEKRVDADNFAKCLDALNGIVWVDDKQVVGLTVIKLFGETPELRIVVREAAAQIPRDGDGKSAGPVERAGAESLRPRRPTRSPRRHGRVSLDAAYFTQRAEALDRIRANLRKVGPDTKLSRADAIEADRELGEAADIMRKLAEHKRARERGGGGAREVEAAHG